jgi:hypothetical protein
MASEVGADQWHFVSTEWLGAAIRRSTGSFIFVNRYGRTFINESKHFPHRKEPLAFTHFDHERAEYPNIPFYCIFDEKFRKSGPLYGLRNSKVGYASWQGLDEWSSDNMAEIEKGWIIKGMSIKELADKLGVDSESLKETVD